MRMSPSYAKARRAGTKSRRVTTWCEACWACGGSRGSRWEPPVFSGCFRAGEAQTGPLRSSCRLARKRKTRPISTPPANFLRRPSPRSRPGGTPRRSRNSTAFRPFATRKRSVTGSRRASKRSGSCEPRSRPTPLLPSPRRSIRRAPASPARPATRSKRSAGAWRGSWSPSRRARPPTRVVKIDGEALPAQHDRNADRPRSRRARDHGDRGLGSCPFRARLTSSPKGGQGGGGSDVHATRRDAAVPAPATTFRAAQPPRNRPRPRRRRITSPAPLLLRLRQGGVAEGQPESPSLPVAESSSPAPPGRFLLVRHSDIQSIEAACPNDVCPLDQASALEGTRNRALVEGPLGVSVGVVGLVAAGVGIPIFIRDRSKRAPANAIGPWNDRQRERRGRLEPPVLVKRWSCFGAAHTVAITPMERTCVSVRRGSAAMKQTRVSTRRGSVAMKQGRVSSRRGSAAMKQTRVSMRRGSAATKQTRVSMRRRSAATKQTRVSMRRGAAAMKQTRVSMRRGVTRATLGATTPYSCLLLAGEIVATRRLAPT